MNKIAVVTTTIKESENIKSNEFILRCKNKNSRILITGGSGVVGTALKEQLNGYDNCYFISSKDYNLISLYETQELFEEYRPEYVFHLAGCVYGIIGNLNNRGASFYNNLMINTNVIECCRKFNVKKILAMGTGSIYPNSSNFLKENEIWNGFPDKSEYSYALAKRAMLGQLMAYNESYGLDYSYVISCNLFGENDRFSLENGHIIPMLIRKFVEQDKVEVWGNGSAIRDFLYAKDAARALVLIMSSDEKVINMCSGIESSIKDVVNILQKLTGKEVNWDNTKPNGQLKRVYDNSILKKLRFFTKYTLEEGIINTLNWFKNNINNFRE